MPVCKLCRERIDLSQTGVRARRCDRCGAAVCEEHFHGGQNLCHECAGMKVDVKKRSFIRKPAQPMKRE